MSEEQRKKVFLMKIWISLIVVFLAILWIVSLKNVWVSNKQSLLGADKMSWADLRSGWQAVVTDVDNNLNQIKASSGSRQAKDAAEGSTWLDGVLEKAEELASSSEVLPLASSSSDILASSTVWEVIKSLSSTTGATTTSK